MPPLFVDALGMSFTNFHIYSTVTTLPNVSWTLIVNGLEEVVRTEIAESECQNIIVMSGIKIIDFDEKQSLITAKI